MAKAVKAATKGLVVVCGKEEEEEEGVERRS